MSDLALCGTMNSCYFGIHEHQNRHQWREATSFDLDKRPVRNQGKIIKVIGL